MIDYTLSITSPLTVGEDVGRAQHILNGHNVFENDWHRGLVDHVFGEETGRSCIRGKFWIGYAEEDLRPTYGPAFDAYLLGEADLTPEMLERIERRMQGTPMREKALAEAQRHLGVKESPPGSNKVLFSDWYGLRGPWCAMFVTYCYVKAGSKAFVRGSRYAYVPYVVADARAGRNGLQVTRDPKAGDLVCYDWDGGVADHIGLFVGWASGSHDAFPAIEGNTAIGNDSNGGEVMRRNRRISQVECFVRVGR